MTLTDRDGIVSLRNDTPEDDIDELLAQIAAVRQWQQEYQWSSMVMPWRRWI